MSELIRLPCAWAACPKATLFRNRSMAALDR